MKKKRAAFLSLGCKVNSYETDAMQKLFEDADYETVDFQEEADVYVINTCTVTNIADRKSRQMLHRARKLHPDAVILAAGCYVQTAQEAVAADPAVDIIIGNNRKSEAVMAVEDFWKKREKKIEDGEKREAVQEEEQHSAAGFVDDLSTPAAYEDLFITGAGERTRAVIKIQDGCNQFCSYCIIPYARGRIRSRRLEDVVKEVTRLAQSGYQEIVLTGIHLSSYGMDFAGKGETPRSHLLEVINAVSKIEGIRRIRLGSLEPNIIMEEFVKTLADNPKFCPHFHLSLQSGCNATLKRMNRHYTAEEYLEKCGLLRKYFDCPAITTDVIAGFPGETEEEFEECRSFLKKAAFSKMHIFPYSRRRGTRAEKMPDQVPDPIKKKRSEALLALEEEMRCAYQQQFVGTVQQILLEEILQIDHVPYWTGHTERYLRVALPLWDKEEHSNQFQTVYVEEVWKEGLLLSRLDTMPDIGRE